jgi:hypothetical protein
VIYMLLDRLHQRLGGRGFGFGRLRGLRLRPAE